MLSSLVSLDSDTVQVFSFHIFGTMDQWQPVEMRRKGWHVECIVSACANLENRSSQRIDAVVHPISYI